MPHFDGHWSPDGKRIVFVYDILQGTDGKLQIDIDECRRHGPEEPAAAQGFFEESPRWSPDGKQIAWTSTRNKNQDIWIMDADGKNPKAPDQRPRHRQRPAWSPDGKQIAFTSARAGNLDIWVMNADGSGQKRLTDNPRMDYWPVWSPDGKQIAFTSNRDGNYEIYLMNADGTEPTQPQPAPRQRQLRRLVAGLTPRGVDLEPRWGVWDFRGGGGEVICLRTSSNY